MFREKIDNISSKFWENIRYDFFFFFEFFFFLISVMYLTNFSKSFIITILMQCRFHKAFTSMILMHCGVTVKWLLLANTLRLVNIYPISITDINDK